MPGRSDRNRGHLKAAAVLSLLLVAAAAGGAPGAQGATKKGPPTAAEARAFIEAAEKRLLELWIRTSRAGWVASTHITDDTEVLAAQAQQEEIAATMDLAAAAARFEALRLPPEVARKLELLKLSLTLPAPRNPAEQEELTRIAASLEADYGKGKYCRGGDPAACLDLNQLSNILATSRDPAELLDAWQGWRTISPPMRQRYARFVELANKGARDLGYADLGELWRSNYDMPPRQFASEMERLWQQVRPLYQALHAHVRAALARHHGAELVPEDGLIPAHLLGNMWSQSWGNIYPLVAPPEEGQAIDLTKVLRARKVGEKEMVRYAERFFTSLGFDPLPDAFWTRSLFTRPADRDVVCHASAWDIDLRDDLRLKMCIEVSGEDFATLHHELGHNYYQRAYNRQPPLFRGSANDGFHEAVGDTVALSVTPAYLRRVGLVRKVPEGDGLGPLMKMALEKVAFLPFGLLVDQWRWKVFSGEIRPADYNRAWWALVERYQGIKSPVPRYESDFDPGAKYHVPANTPYARYFLATVLQFQFHRALCREAGYAGPLDECSIYDNKAAGERLAKMLEMGKSRPWPEALEALTGEKQIDATALLDYFAPLKKWLDEQNAGRRVGF